MNRNNDIAIKASQNSLFPQALAIDQRELGTGFLNSGRNDNIQDNTI
jgi:hypothetical protein